MYTVTYRVLTVWTRPHFGPVGRHWFLVNVDSPWEMKQNVRISRKRLQLLLDRITLGFSLLIPFKDFKCYGERGGRGLPISSYGGDWRIFGGLKFSIPGFFWLVFHLRGDFLHFHWWNRRSSRVSRVSLFFFGGGLIFVPIRSFCHLKSGVTPPPPPPPPPPPAARLRTGCQKKNCYVYNSSTCICSHEAVNLTKSQLQW